MSNESAACHDDSTREGVESKLVIGTLVELLTDGEPVVELDGPDGEEQRCTAIASIQIEATMVGQPVELTFVSDLARPVIVGVIDVRAVLRARWDDLGRRVLGLDPVPSKLSAMVGELRVLACTVAWLDSEGVITHGAVRIGTSRKSLREHVRRWKRLYPRLGPPLSAEQATDEPDGSEEAGAESMTLDVPADAPAAATE
ncbi:DUF6484 domain-containing protein [Paraliomyxa miuraensis]|uniref:DUF6484 domain-containing protein n=1 Tax=Paraliomyxa miuraensis TaxID=376150 RepID=UPI002257DDE1|nr:DUF6484 domain-containing protein [Paraliomyxa miuraensis]MCX4240174.1 DUF6484 domain-containing protein [Paraliomyxa miuraensis]